MLLTGTQMIFPVQFGINKHLLKARAILLVFEKIYLCLFIPNCTRNHLITYTNIHKCTSEDHVLQFFRNVFLTVPFNG